MLDHGLRAFGRRNLPIREFLARAHPATDPKVDPRAGLLPLYHLKDESGDHYLYTAEELESHHQAHRPASADAADAAPGHRRVRRRACWRDE